MGGAAIPMEAERLINECIEKGFQPTEKKNGKEVWKDICILGLFTKFSLPDWLEIHPEKCCAYLKGTDPNGLIYGSLWLEDLQVIGAMIGDIAGSGYEHHNIKYKPNRLIRYSDIFTDDTVLTYAVALGIIEGMKKVDRSAWMTDKVMQDTVEREIALTLKRFARKYPDVDYGGKFKEWARSDAFEPCDSLGNGSAMRASFAGWYADSLEEAELLGRVSANFTHGRPEGIKGAMVVAGCIYLLRTGHGKDKIREYVSKHYNIGFTLDKIRPFYKFDVSCEGSVPQAIVAFLEEDSFEEVIRAAISIGGDSDTIAAIAGSLAEAYYPVPKNLTLRAWEKLDSGMKLAVRTVTEVLRQTRPNDFTQESNINE
jgi:ADP-ribosylglycohydrolase